MQAPEIEDGAAAWRWFGARPALDFVNTVRCRYAGGVDTLCSEADLAAWLQAAGVTAEHVSVDARGLRAARRLREAINDAVTATVEHERVPALALRQINRWLAQSARAPMLVAQDGTLQLQGDELTVSLDGCLAAIALDAARMLGSEDRGRVRVCAAEHCGMRFYDRSPAGRRRWCSSSRCGNVERARRFRARRAASDD
jgi:predicted RNA-binding Zn ribbon-like protein